MKKIFQSLQNGKTFVEDVPMPNLDKNDVLIQTEKTLISSGTEKMLIDFGKSNIFNKIKSNKDKFSQVLNKAKNDGLIETYTTVKNKLNNPIDMGYCNLGTIVKLGKDVDEFKIGDKIISNGSHAEFVTVNKNLCCKVDKDLNDDDIIFSILAAISLHGIRMSYPTLGEKFAVIGLGIIGLISCMILRANGCNVLAIDINSYKIKKARELGFDTLDLSKINNPKDACLSFSDNYGLDGAILCINSENSNAIKLSSEILRKRGRIVLIGNSKINISREIFYKKELNFSVSRSYGPGRYEKKYEKDSLDYPIDYVRWTEKRNIEAVLFLIKKNKLAFSNLISKSFDFKNYHDAYNYLKNNNNSFGIILNYSRSKKQLKNIGKTIDNLNIKKFHRSREIVVGFIGAGNYAKKIIPIFNKNKNVKLKVIVSRSGISANFIGKKYSFEKISSDVNSIFNDKEINLVVICTNHDSHSKYVLECISKNKNFYVEKPLSISLLDLNKINNKIIKKNIKFIVGFNRRYSEYIKSIKKELDQYNVNKTIVMNINAGNISNDSWINDLKVGGGRLVSELCHFLDLAKFLINHKISKFNKISHSNNSNNIFSVQLKFEDGSIVIINYMTNGHFSYPKEQYSFYFSNKIIFLDNFKKIKYYGFGLFKNKRSFSQDKGQNNMINNFIESLIDDKENIVPFEDIYEVNKLLLDINDA